MKPHQYQFSRTRSWHSLFTWRLFLSLWKKFFNLAQRKNQSWISLLWRRFQTALHPKFLILCRSLQVPRTTGDWLQRGLLPSLATWGWEQQRRRRGWICIFKTNSRLCVCQQIIETFWQVMLFLGASGALIPTTLSSLCEEFCTFFPLSLFH